MKGQGVWWIEQVVISICRFIYKCISKLSKAMDEGNNPVDPKFWILSRVWDVNCCHFKTAKILYQINRSVVCVKVYIEPFPMFEESEELSKTWFFFVAYWEENVSVDYQEQGAKAIMLCYPNLLILFRYCWSSSLS